MSDVSHSDSSTASLRPSLSLHTGSPDLGASRGTIGRAQPLMNNHQQYVCNVSPECAKLTFARKCEWRQVCPSPPYHSSLTVE